MTISEAGCDKKIYHRGALIGFNRLLRRDCTKTSIKTIFVISYYNVLMLQNKISFKITWVKKNVRPSLNRSNVLMKLHSWQFRVINSVNPHPTPLKKENYSFNIESSYSWLPPTCNFIPLFQTLKYLWKGNLY